MKDTQISAYIDSDTKQELDRLVRARGLKKGYVVERALQHHLRALSEIPEEFILPPRLTVTRESLEKILAGLATPPKPSSELRKLMKGEVVSEDGLH